jgi:predicted methyltransferase MtxX (methanogen marker protein 4)
MSREPNPSQIVRAQAYVRGATPASEIMSSATGISIQITSRQCILRNIIATIQDAKEGVKDNLGDRGRRRNVSGY